MAADDNNQGMPSPTPPDLPSQPQLLRFGLRQLFIVVTLLTLLCGAMTLTRGPWPIVIGSAALLVAGHVLANLIGTRLRDTSKEVRDWRASDPTAAPDSPQAHTGPIDVKQLHLPPSTPLANHKGVNGRWVTLFMAAGGGLGTILGACAIYAAIGSRIGWPGLLVAAISSGVLGTWVAFLASSFGIIARNAWRHADQRD